MVKGKFGKTAKGLFSCDVHDSQKDILGGKPLQNLDFKKKKWKAILSISNTVLQKKEESKE